MNSATLHDITDALSKKNYLLLAMQAVDLARQNKGEAILSKGFIEGLNAGSDYLDLFQYLCGGTLEENPVIGTYRRALLLEKGYEKVGNFFKARYAEYKHIIPHHSISDFGYDLLAEHIAIKQDFSEPAIIQGIQDQAAFILFHGMLRPLYKELEILDELRRVIPGAHILDYGSDNGDVSLMAAIHGHQITYAQYEGYLLKTIDRRFRLRKLTGKALPLSARMPVPELAFSSYDIIFVNNSLAYTSNPLVLLEEFRAALRHDGYLVLTRYPFEDPLINPMADSQGRQQTLLNYLDQHFEKSAMAGIYKKL